MTRKRILVTGGAGFVGSHLCERLLADGHEVICLDNFFTGTHANVTHLRDNPRFEIFRHDVQEALTMEVDQIFHLACPASPIHYQRNPVRTIRTAVEGTLNLLDAARECGARMLIASTSEVYGDPAQHPQTEAYWGNVNPIGPRACYDEGKRCAEALATSYSSQYGVEVRIARIFNTYGPRMHENDGRVVSNFVVQALTGKSLTVFGDPRESSMLELATMVRQMTGSKSEIVHAPLPKDDPVRRNPDISRAKKLLGGWTPVVPLEKGIAETIAYFKGVVRQG
jgi:UDP-glucuronate decarboxylase